jgi:hypothetical protein
MKAMKPGDEHLAASVRQLPLIDYTSRAKESTNNLSVVFSSGLYCRVDSEMENSVGKRIADGSVPKTLFVALVRNGGVQCMAFRDKDEKWRDYFHLTELTGEVEVVSTF